MKTCEVADCERPTRSSRNRWCERHYQRLRLYGRLDLLPVVNKGRMCSIEGCDKPSQCRTYCSIHYDRWQRHGSPHIALAPQGPPEERFWRKVEKTEGCWLWRGAIADTGYGTFNRGDGYISAHRYAYELAGRVIPDGYHLDHLCRVRSCCNPDHLEPVTGVENIRRAVRIGHHPNAPTTCKRGHDWIEHPPYLAHRSDGRVTRRCRVCHLDRDKAKRRSVTENPAEALRPSRSELRIGEAT